MYPLCTVVLNPVWSIIPFPVPLSARSSLHSPFNCLICEAVHTLVAKSANLSHLHFCANPVWPYIHYLLSGTVYSYRSTKATPLASIKNQELDPEIEILLWNMVKICVILHFQRCGCAGCKSQSHFSSILRIIIFWPVGDLLLLNRVILH